MHGSNDNDKRDGKSIYVISTNKAETASIWELIECENGDNNYIVQCHGNVDGRKVGIGYSLSIHDSNKRDKRDNGSYYIHVRINDGKATRWMITSS